MRIVHIIDSGGMFGAEYVVLNLLPALHEMGEDVILVCMSPVDSPGADLGRLLEKRNIQVKYIDETKKISLKGLWKIFKILKYIQPDILHTHGYKATIIGGLIASLCRIPIYVTYHGEARQCPELWAYARIENIFLKLAYKIIAVSSNIRNELLTRGISENKVVIVPNGINDSSDGKKECPNSYRKGQYAINILCLGRLITLKRFDLVIEAVHILRKEFPGVHLTIAGSGPSSNSLRQKIEVLGLSDSVYMPGYMENTIGLFKEADIFVIASEMEGSPIVLIEAMAFSLPIITTNVGAIPTMVCNFEDALIVPPNDIGALVESIRYLILHPEIRKRIGKAARNQFIKNYTAQVMAKNYYQHYQESLK